MTPVGKQMLYNMIMIILAVIVLGILAVSVLGIVTGLLSWVVL